MKRFSLLLLTFALTVNVIYAASIRQTVTTIASLVPVNTQNGQLIAISYDEPNNEVLTEFLCSDDFLTSFDQSKEISLAAFITGLFMASNPSLQPFNLVLIVKTPGNPTGRTFYENESKMGQIIEFARQAFADSSKLSVDDLIERVEEAPMQCDPEGAFCFTLDFNKKDNEIVVNLQILEDFDPEALMGYVDMLAKPLGKSLASSVRIFEPLMKRNGIGVRINMFQSTANEPFKTIRYTPEELFDE